MNYEFHPEAEQEFIETAARYELEFQGWERASGPRLIALLSCFLIIQRLARRLTRQYGISCSGVSHSRLYMPLFQSRCIYLPLLMEAESQGIGNCEGAANNLLQTDQIKLTCLLLSQRATPA
jgi:hypothetical protein